MNPLEKNNNGDVLWKVGQAEYKGYVRAKLEGMHEDIVEMKGAIKENKDEINNIKLKAVTFGSISGFIGGFIGSLARGFGLIP